jgi:hypothetical protein
MFVSSRTDRIAQKFEEVWWERYGAAGSVPPVMQIPLADATALLGVPANYTREDVIAAFRREVKKAHPDARRHSRDILQAGRGPRSSARCSRYERTAAKGPPVDAQPGPGAAKITRSKGTDRPNRAPAMAAARDPSRQLCVSRYAPAPTCFGS